MTNASASNQLARFDCGSDRWQATVLSVLAILSLQACSQESSSTPGPTETVGRAPTVSATPDMSMALSPTPVEPRQPTATKIDTDEVDVETLALRSIVDVGFEARVVDVAGGHALIGGDGIALAQLDGRGGVTSVRRYEPPSPSALGLVRESDLLNVPKRVTGGDLEIARALLSDEGTSIEVRAVAIRPPFGYTAIEWPVPSGLVWLHIIDLESPGKPELVGATRIAYPTDETVSPYVSVMGAMALAGNRLLVGTHTGLVEVDITNPAAPEVRSPAAGLHGTITGISVSQDQGSAWVSDARFGFGTAFEIDLHDSFDLQRSSEIVLDQGLLDVVVLGDIAFAATGSEGSRIWILDLQRPTEPLNTHGIVSSDGSPIDLDLSRSRLYALAVSKRGQVKPAPGAAIRFEYGRKQVHVFDLAHPKAPELLESVSLPDGTMSIHVYGQHLYAATGEPGLHVYEIMDN